ncbi:MAG: hypothetical protein ABIR76_12660 [Polaromonas sp.]
MNLNTLAIKAAKGPNGGAMQVEDMIRFVLFHGEQAADEIDRLQAHYRWPMDGLLPDGSRVAPLGRWTKVCVAFGRNGAVGLVPLLSDEEDGSFAAAILEKVHTPESVEVLLTFCERENSSGWLSPDPMHPVWKAMGALNLLLGLEDYVSVDASVLDRLRHVVWTRFSHTPIPARQATLIYALRGAPSRAALEWLENLKITDESLIYARKACIKSMKSRLALTHRALNMEEKRQVRKKRALDV